MPETSAISNLELAALRQESRKFMPEVSVRVHLRTGTKTASGGKTYAIATNPVRTSLGRLAPMEAALETFYADRLGGRQGWTITLPEDPYVPVVPLGSVLRVGARQFEVIGSDTVRSFQITRRWDCVELT